MPGLNERTDGFDAMSLANSATEIRIGTLFATLSYGDWDLNDTSKTNAQPGAFANQIDEGFDDDYRGFVAEDQTFTAANGAWTVLDAAALGTHWATAYANAQAGRPAADDSEFAFTTGGLYHGFIDAPDPAIDQQHGGFGDSNALLLQQGSTLVLAFRGTDAKDGSLASGQTFTGDGAFYHYEAFRPLIEAALAYAADSGNGIDNIIVAGHSLGGLMADIFTAVDAARFADLPNIAGHIKVVSLASPGIDPDAFTDAAQGFLNNHDQSVAHVAAGQLTLTNPDPYYIAINHNKDRVADSVNAEYASAIQALLHELNPVDLLQENVHFASGVKIFMPNLSNTSIDYHYPDLPDSGFGTHHNEGIYLHNLEALTQSSLLSKLTNHKIIAGVGHYDHMKSNWLVVNPDDVGSKTLQGAAGAEFILGLEGNDKILGGGGRDLLDGGTGNDELNGGLGADSIEGSTGTDTASYATSALAVTVNLVTNVNLGGEAHGDKLYNIENLTGSETGNDSLTGNSGNNLLSGLGGDDSLFGGAGTDILLGGSGADTLDGGDGQDRANYYAAQAGVTVNLLTNINSGGEAAGDLLFGIEQVSGSNTGADVLTGDGNANRFYGNGGNDVLKGDAGNDRLSGGIGNDNLAGGTGSDVLMGDAGNDRMNGGHGDDSFIFDASLGAFGNDTIVDFAAGDTVSLIQSGLANFANLLAAMSDLGSTILLTTNAGTITFENVADVSVFAADDFVLL